MPLFSVVTSVYNAEAFIKKALTSVRDQTEKDYEYIVVDNGSTDHSNSIIKQFVKDNPDMNIQLHRVEPNRGISGGRNTGISLTTGEYVCFLDADDYWCPEKLHTVKEYISENPESDVFCHWEKHIKGNTCTIGEYRQIDNNDAYEDLLFQGNCFSTSAMVIKSKLLKNIGGFDISLVSGQEDYDCWLRLARAGAVCHMIEEPLGVWTVREDSVSAKHIAHAEAVIAMLDKHFDYLMKKKVEEVSFIQKKKRHIFAVIYCGCGRELSTSKNRKDALQMYKKAIQCDWSYWKSYAGVILHLLKL